MNSTPIREFRRLLRRFEQLTQTQASCCCGVTMPQCQALLEIELLETPSLKQLSDKLKLDASTLSRTVDGLVNLGLVRRTPNPDDRRYLVLSLTEKGQQTCDQINAESDSYYKQVFQAIPEQRREEVLEVFALFVGAMSPTLSQGVPDNESGKD